ncbi:stimulated by retinoic acid gene 6 protein-like isoform X2 [Ostrea edulis]|uniref:stimulated by retinoic acid gene 6 protein-like isoform X2 n=1 Tax=Ostrea edulis TaxID=37623 RepID=UPI0024AF86B6|nr:stimulated by retinoic acid gene 6 protein-like isoform X2 [Ostrea edulis]
MTGNGHFTERRESSSVTYATNSTNTSSQITCADVERLLYGYDLLPALGVFTILILIFLEKRRYKKSILFGRPGLPVPINILDGNKNALPTAACFGCCINYLFYILFFKDESANVEPWLAPFYLLQYVISMGISYYPLFACVNSTSKFGPPIIGFLYTSMLFLISLTEYTFCVNNVIEFCGYLPYFVCEGYLLCVFAFKLVYQIYKYATGRAKQKSKHATSPQYIHVRELLDKDTEVESQGLRDKLKNRTRQLLDETKLCCLKNNLRRCTMRTVTVNFVVLLSFYQFFILFVEASNVLYKLQNGFNGYLRSLNVSLGKVDVYVDTVYFSFIVAQALSVVYIVSMMVMIYFSQKQHLLQIWRGDKSFIPKKCLNMDCGEMMAKSLMYAGTQVSHLLGSYLISILVIFAICMLIAFLVVLPLMGKVPNSFLQPVKFLIPSVVAAFIFVLSLRKLTERLFLQRHWVSSENGNGVRRVLALNNRKVYHNFAFFLFFFYIVLGLFKCFKRVAYSLVIGLIFVPRLDRSVLVSGFEHYDNGYMIYISLLNVELAHCHPVLRVFCEVLLKTISNRGELKDFSLSAANSIDIESVKTSYRSMKSVSARTYNNQIWNKWMKILTLNNNPSLCKTSKTNNNFEPPRLTKTELV